MNFLPDPIQFYKIHVEEYFEHFSSYRYYHMRFRRQTLAISCRIVCSIQMEKSMKEFKLIGSRDRVRGRRRRTSLSGFCPDLLCGVCLSKSEIFRREGFRVGKLFDCPSLEFELDFDRPTPHSKSGRNLDSAVRRRLVEGQPLNP